MAEMDRPRVPPQALLISLLSLFVPVLSSSFFPAWTSDTVGVLVWLLALVPAFLLSFYRGWQGASVALAGGMAAFSVAQAILVALDAPSPSPLIMAWLVGALIVVALGSGGLSTVFHRARRKIETLALTDPGTGLANRRHALLHLEREFAGARRGDQLAVALFDLDSFKQINDRFGHAVGDEILVRFAGVLESRTRAVDLSCRWGGEEFLTILRDCDEEGGRQYAEQVRQQLESLDLPWGEVTVSAGVAAHEQGMASPDVLVGGADRALYRAKDDGRNRVRVLSEASAPASAAEPDSDAARSRHRSSRSRPRGEVLVVDDNRPSLRSVARALRRTGYSVLEAEGPESALQIVQGIDRAPDLVIADVIMPSMTGFRLVELLSEDCPEIRAVYMSGYLQEDLGWEEGKDDDVFLSKPFTVDELTDAVERALHHGEPRAAPRGAPAESDESRVEDAPAPEASSPDEDTPILVVSDATPSTSRIAFHLRHLGYSRIRALSEPHRLSDGLKEKNPTPELVLLDVPDAREEGEEWLEQAREALPDVPVLALSTSSWPAYLAGSGQWGYVDFLRKPYELEELGMRVRSLLRLVEASRARETEIQSLEARLKARTAELEGARTELLIRLARAAEFRDDLTGAHAARVGILTGLLAESLGLGRQRAEVLEMAAPLHDVGKIAVPDSILNKPSRLTPGERTIMERHTTVGAELLAGSRHPLLQEAEAIALAHHERWDGTGYPRAIAGEDIPVAARIVAVVDVFDSITHARPYRDALSMEGALDEIRRGRGTEFDPAVVDVFIDLAKEGRLDLAREHDVVARPDRRPLLEEAWRQVGLLTGAPMEEAVE